MRNEIDMIELVDDTWAVYDGEGGTYSPDEADQIALAIIRMAEEVRRKNGERDDD